MNEQSQETKFLEWLIELIKRGGQLNDSFVWHHFEKWCEEWTNVEFTLSGPTGRDGNYSLTYCFEINKKSYSYNWGKDLSQILKYYCFNGLSKVIRQLNIDEKIFKIQNNYSKYIMDLEHMIYNDSYFCSPHIIQGQIDVWSLTEEDSYSVNRGVGKDNADHVDRTTNYYVFIKNYLLNDEYLFSLLPKEKTEQSVGYSYTSGGSSFGDTLYILRYEPEITKEIKSKYDEIKHYTSLIQDYGRIIKEGDDWRIKKDYNSFIKGENDTKNLLNR